MACSDRTHVFRKGRSFNAVVTGTIRLTMVFAAYSEPMLDAKSLSTMHTPSSQRKTFLDYRLGSLEALLLLAYTPYNRSEYLSINIIFLSDDHNAVIVI